MLEKAENEAGQTLRSRKHVVHVLTQYEHCAMRLLGSSVDLSKERGGSNADGGRGTFSAEASGAEPGWGGSPAARRG